MNAEGSWILLGGAEGRNRLAIELATILYEVNEIIDVTRPDGAVFIVDDLRLPFLSYKRA